MLECPDGFEQNDHFVTVVSTIEMPANGLKYPGKQPVIGLIDVEKNKPVEVVFDNGFDFYAAETVETTDKRRVMIGWMLGSDDFAPRYLEHQWNNMMTIPRELYVKDDTILQVPVRELEALRQDEHMYAGNTMSIKCDRVCELSVDVCLNSAHKITIHTAESEGEFFSIEYDVKRQVIRIDRSKAGYYFGKDGEPETKPYREAMLPTDEGRLGLRIFMDRSSCEIFSKDGRLVMSNLMCPKGSADGFSCVSDDNSAEFMVKAWKLKTN